MEKEEIVAEMPFSSPSLSSFKKGFANFSEGVLALIKIRETFSSLCHCASSPDSPEVGTGGKSLFATGCSYASQRDTPFPPFNHSTIPPPQFPSSTKSTGTPSPKSSPSWGEDGWESW